MRKLIVAFTFMVITLTSYAQSGSEHLTFKGFQWSTKGDDYRWIERFR